MNSADNCRLIDIDAQRQEEWSHLREGVIQPFCGNQTGQAGGLWDGEPSRLGLKGAVAVEVVALSFGSTGTASSDSSARMAATR
jgi:hypothetical protein